MAIVAEITENECIIERHLRDIDSLRDSMQGPVLTSVFYMTDMVEGRSK